MLEAFNLACQRGDRWLFKGLGLALAPGRGLRVAGSNGAGKTSLLRLLAGLGLPAAGEVHWSGRAIAGQREAYAGVLRYLGHLAGLKDELSAAENLSIEAGLDGATGASAEAVAEALASWGLARHANLPLRVLSAGQRRRVALARLQVCAAPLWILDEPFNALDGQATQQLAAQLDTHLSQGGLLVLTSHQDMPMRTAALQTLSLSS